VLRIPKSLGQFQAATFIPLNPIAFTPPPPTVAGMSTIEKVGIFTALAGAGILLYKKSASKKPTAKKAAVKKPTKARRVSIDEDDNE
jgi:hypothetical protein